MAHPYVFLRRGRKLRRKSGAIAGRRRGAIAGQMSVMQVQPIEADLVLTARPVTEIAGPALGLPTRSQVRAMEAEGVVAIKQVINRQTGEGGPRILAVVSEVT